MKKTLFLLFLWGLLTIQIFFSIRASSTRAYSVDNFNLEIENGSSIGLQSDYTLLINVTSGTLNGSSANLRLYNDEGRIAFHAEDDSQILITCPDAKYGFNLEVNGANSFSHMGDYNYIADILSGDNVVILWSWRLESWVDKYTILGIGLSGLLMMVFAPSWVALKIKKEGITPDSIERIGYAMLIFVVGFGMMVIWLWS